MKNGGREIDECMKIANVLRHQICFKILLCDKASDCNEPCELDFLSRAIEMRKYANYQTIIKIVGSLA